MKRINPVQRQQRFAPDKVRYLIGDTNYCYIHLTDDRKILSSRTLKWYAERWPHFIRIHKKALVNPLHIDCVIRESSVLAKVIMQDGATLGVGRRRIDDVLNGIQAVQYKYPLGRARFNRLPDRGSAR